MRSKKASPFERPHRCRRYESTLFGRVRLAFFKKEWQGVCRASVRSNISSLYPSPELWLGVTACADSLLSCGVFPTRELRDVLSGRPHRGGRGDLARQWLGVGIAARILRVLRERRSVLAAHGVPNPSESYFFSRSGKVAAISAEGSIDYDRVGSFYFDFIS